MNIHEYQAKALLRDYGLPILKGHPAFSVDEALSAAEDLGGPVWVVKAQIHAGGRGKAGGVKVVRSIDDVRQAADALLGSTLVTHQTGPKGKEVHRLYIEDGCAIADEFYLSLLIDRKSGAVVIVASKEGGVDIEEVAANSPEKILSVKIDPATGLMPFHTRRVAFALGLKGETAKQAEKAIKGLYRAFCDLDAGLVEINPLVVTEAGDVVLLDAKLSFDNNALFRHAEIADLRDKSEEDPTEVKAKEYDLNYIKLDGNIGCMVNGAGLAMATMDLIKLKGAAPANFLDVGGGATREKVTAALKIILSDEHVEGILVNIFGGIMRCDIIAQGIVEAAREVDIHVPLVVRLEGTKVTDGKEILGNSGLPIISADNLDDAADKVVAAISEKA